MSHVTHYLVEARVSADIPLLPGQEGSSRKRHTVILKPQNPAGYAGPTLVILGEQSAAGRITILTDDEAEADRFVEGELVALDFSPVA